MNIDNLFNQFVKNELPKYTNDMLVEKIWDFRKENSTSQGLYIYLKFFREINKDQQDELRGFMSEKLCDLYQDVYCDYMSFVSEYSHENDWFVDEMKEEGLEEGTDDYYEMWEEYLMESESLNLITLLDLVLFDLIDDYYRDLTHFGDEELILKVKGIFNDVGLDWDEIEGESVYFDFDYEKVQWVVKSDTSDEEMSLDEVKEMAKNISTILVD